MEKEKFETMQFFVSRFDAPDVIATSGEGSGGTNTPEGDYGSTIIWGQEDVNGLFGE